MSVEQTTPAPEAQEASSPGVEQMRPGATAVGMIGVGDMGGPIARSVLRAGYAVTAFDLRREAVEELVPLGAKAAESISALCATCDVAVIVVMNDAQVNDVVSTILAAPGQVRTVIVSSTVPVSRIPGGRDQPVFALLIGSLRRGRRSIRGMGGPVFR